MAKKKWGQNFLIHQNIVDSIVNSAEVKDHDSILEIGPGNGILTATLLDRMANVVAIEIDPKLCQGLKERFRNKKFTLLEIDVMELSQETLSGLIPAPAKVVANLPYNIATQLIVKMLPIRDSWQSLTLMVQAEVAERICATPKSKKVYGPLSLVGALGFNSTIIRKISSNSFEPAPKVDSAVIQLLPRPSGLSAENEKRFLIWSRLLFQQRRKKLINGIRKHFPRWYLMKESYLHENLRLKRPENLDFTEWMSLFSDYIKVDQN